MVPCTYSLAVRGQCLKDWDDKPVKETSGARAFITGTYMHKRCSFRDRPTLRIDFEQEKDYTM
jgi:hypothetical protein